MSLKDFIKNRPFEPDPEVLEILRNWAQPDFQAEKPTGPVKTNALLKKPPQPGQKLQAREPEPEVIKPLTAEDIEQIRQAAFEEGLGQGKEEGFSQGYQDGREQGYQDGLQQGQAEGKKQGLTEGETLIAAQLHELRQLLDQLQQPLRQVDVQVQQQLLALSVAMAQAVTDVEVSINPQFILNTLRQAIDALPLQSQQVRILLAPADLAVVKQHYSEADLAERGWQLLSEPALTQGDIRVQSGDSSIERPLRQRLKQSLEHFLHTEGDTPITTEQPEASVADITTQSGAGVAVNKPDQ